MGRRRTRLCAAAVLSAGLVACGSGDRADDTLAPLPGVELPPSPTRTVTTASTAPAPSAVSSAPPTPTTEIPASTVVVTAIAPPPTDAPVPPTAVSTTAAPTTAVPTTTTPPPAPSTAPPDPGPVELRTDGLGAVGFGATPEDAIETVSSLLGSAPTYDSGWTDPASIGGCPGSEARAVAWGALTLYFGDDSDVASGRRHFFTYYYGEDDEPDAPPTGLVTPEAAELGMTVAELSRVYDDVDVFPGGPDYPPTFVTSTGLFGIVSGRGERARVSVIAGGMGCGR